MLNGWKRPYQPLEATQTVILMGNTGIKTWLEPLASDCLFLAGLRGLCVCVCARVPSYVSDCISKQCDNAMKVFRLKLLKRRGGGGREKEEKKQEKKKNTSVAGFCSSLSLIPLLQNASLVTADSQAPLINAPNENVWLWVAECDCLKPLGFWCNPTEDAGVTPDF